MLSRINIVVAFSRLSRSLVDFVTCGAVDQHRVSFVWVTQTFNTTTSMGWLTRNVLLSFAQSGGR